MKIGQVAKKYNVSIDTINYYVNYGLLVPSRKGGQRDFDPKTLSDLERLLELKALDFTLGDIHKILSLYRISDLASKQDVDEMIAYYCAKKQECVQESKRLSGTIRLLDAKVHDLQCKLTTSTSNTGLPLKMLDLLCCPLCGEDLNVSDINMNTRFIFSGFFVCNCGYHAEIRNGIMLTPNKNIDVYDTPDIIRNTYRHLPPHLITLFQNSYNWMLKQMKDISFENKVIMETYINAWFFLHNHQQYLHPKGQYIIVDKYPETLASYKSIIEEQGFDLDILYIADSSTNLPLKSRSVDINIDFFAVNEHNFYHNSFLWDELVPYFSDHAIMLGTYFYFRDGRKSMKQLIKEYPTCAEHNFNLTYFMDAMKKGKYMIQDYKDIGYTTDSGDNIGFSFHITGEQMHLISYCAGAQADTKK